MVVELVSFLTYIRLILQKKNSSQEMCNSKLFEISKESSVILANVREDYETPLDSYLFDSINNPKYINIYCSILKSVSKAVKKPQITKQKSQNASKNKTKLCSFSLRLNDSNSSSFSNFRKLLTSSSNSELLKLVSRFEEELLLNVSGKLELKQLNKSNKEEEKAYSALIIISIE